MAFVLAGLVGPACVGSDFGPDAELHRLRQGFVMRSLTDLRLLNRKALAADVMTVATRASQTGHVVYLEAEFFGGTGAQAALGWHNGECVLGPLRTQSPGEGLDGFEEVTDVGAWAINRALAWLGVREGEGRDAFDAIGLGARRDWLAGG